MNTYIRHLCRVLLAGIFVLGLPLSAQAFSNNSCAAKSTYAANPCAAKNPCAANPCAAKNPCAANPCAAKNPCAANPCAAKNPCAANPCATKNPCGASASLAKQITRPAGTKLFAADRAGLVAEGKRLFNDPGLGTSGMSCETCHRNNMTFKPTFAQPYPHPVAMASGQAGMKQIQLDEMVQLCVVVPLKGKPLGWESRELAALTAYTEVRQKAFMAMPMNPCAAKQMNPCAAKQMNPCAAKRMNPCAAKQMNPCGGR